jgi:hypothetical protein
MPTKEMIKLGPDDQKIADFLEMIGAKGQARVFANGEILIVKVSRDAISQAGRDFLAKGGVIND